MAKMWAGRFKKEIDAKVNDFNSSLSFDSRLYKEDIEGSVAHAAMLGSTGIIGKKDADLLVAELGKLKDELASGLTELPQDAEDVHMAIEQLLTERIGDAGKRLHTARSRNDQVALDLRLYLRKEIDKIANLVKNLILVIVEKAEKCEDTVMPGYTHLQRAQPVSFAHYILAYGMMFARDLTRLADCKKRMNFCPLGSGALAGSTFPIDRAMVAEALGFDGPTENSIDGVSDRDYAVELLGAISLIMVHLSRFSEEIVLWCSSEFSFIELDDAFATGSSIMPQKKNPDVAELARGKSGRVFGDLMGLLTVMKGLPLAYNKDMQEDKQLVFDAVDAVKICLDVFADMLESVSVNEENLKNAASRGFINATDCADYLVKKGMPFRDAYKMSGALVARCISEGKTLETLSLEEYQSVSPLFGKDVYQAIDLAACKNGRKTYGGPSGQSVARQIKFLKTAVGEKL